MMRSKIISTILYLSYSPKLTYGLWFLHSSGSPYYKYSTDSGECHFSWIAWMQFQCISLKNLSTMYLFMICQWILEAMQLNRKMVSEEKSYEYFLIPKLGDHCHQVNLNITNGDIVWRFCPMWPLTAMFCE